jgi:oligopeptide transport system substrate-binding protein
VRTLLVLILSLTVGTLLWLTASPEARRADFVVASDQIRLIDPHRVSFQDEMQLTAALFEGLTRLAPGTLEPEPGAAASWEVSPDGLDYTFHLRPEARWSNGQPLVAGDFRWAWLRVLDPANECQYAALLFCIAGAETYYRSRLSGAQNAAPPAPAESVGIEAPDARTLRVRLAVPTPWFLELLAMPVLAPVWPPLLERFAYREGVVLRSTRHLWTRPEHLVCNGPFRLEQWDFKRRLLLRRNPHYWDPDAVHVETIEVYLSSNANAALIAYETGRVDLVRGLEAEVARRLQRDQAAGRRRDLHIGDRFATFFFRVNCARPPLNDARLRKALSLAIDRVQICEHVLGLGETPAETYVPRGALPLLARRSADGAPVRYEPPAGLGAGLSHAERVALARKLLAESGFDRLAAGRPIEIAFAPEPAQFRRVAEAVQEMWQRDLGLRVELRAIEAKVLSERIRRLDYDLARSNWFGDYLDPASFLEMFTSLSGQNRTGWACAEYDRLIAQAAGETDSARRFSLLREAERILCEEELPILPVYFMRGNFLLRPGFTGLEDNLRGVLPIHRVQRGGRRAPGRTTPAAI